MRLDGKVALVTGAGSGMGAAISRRFVAEGASVALVDLDLDAARGVAAEQAQCAAIQADVADSASVDRAFSAASDQLGDIDFVVHAAGLDDRKIKAEIAESGGTASDFTMRMS